MIMANINDDQLNDDDEHGVGNGDDDDDGMRHTAAKLCFLILKKWNRQRLKLHKFVAKEPKKGVPEYLRVLL